ncbi:2OG-Fe(II) oxygenase superfamily protein [Thozetella sp. PMI_491]|nr:2OG-Fe(II) oxygenase superfamily protein [Thozetella sp. PMI_491]
MGPRPQNAVEGSPCPPGFTKLLLNSYNGPYYKIISTKAPRDCTADEVPVIDLARLDGDLGMRKMLAKEIIRAAETTGFFYIKNHGVSEETIKRAHDAALAFFKSPLDKKAMVSEHKSKYFIGWSGLKETGTTKESTLDRREVFHFRYDPANDPLHAGEDLSKIPEDVRKGFGYEDFIWTDIGVPNFRSDAIRYWQACLALSRRLIRIVALGLELPETYFDPLVTYPGADAAMNYYPGHGDAVIDNPDEVGLGAHTDLQVFTLLWQDEHRGLQVLNKEAEWLSVTPIPGTFVVNIGDFLMRTTNDRLKSTVHRVIQHGKVDRISMPIFFGFNFNEMCSVVPTCTSEDNPAKYEPVVCGELVIKRLKGLIQ